MKADYTIEEGKPVIHLLYRLADGSRVHERHTDFIPHFFVPASPVAHYLSNDVERGLALGQPHGVPIIRAETVLPTDVPHERLKYETTWEAKTFFNNRFLIDRVHKHLDQSPPVQLTLDIEMVQLSGVWRIICIGYKSSSEDIYHEILFPFENSLPASIPLNGIVKLQKDPLVEVPYELHIVSSFDHLLNFFLEECIRLQPDVYIGWNVHFDLHSIFTSCQELNPNSDYDLDMNRISPIGDVHPRKGFRGQDELYIGGCSIFNATAAARNLLPPQRDFTLKWIAKKFINFEKPKYRPRAMLELWHSNPHELIRYNLGDVYAPIALMEEKQLFSHFYERSVEAVCNLEDTYPMWKWLLFLAMRQDFRKGSKLRLPTHLETSDRKCKGPRYILPVPGVHDTVIGVDFAGLYPAIARGWNMSPETLSPDGDLEVGNGICFFSKPQGVWPQLIEFLYERKDFYDAQVEDLHLTDHDKLRHPLYHRRKAYKTASVATTGLFNWKGFIMFVPEILDSIFFLSRDVVDYVVSRVEARGYQPLYGHTDSIFLKVKSFDEIPSLLKWMNELLDDYVREKGLSGSHHFRLDVDYRCKSIFFDKGQSRYAFIDFDTEELVIRGFEGKKVNMSDFASEIQRHFLKIILETKSESQARAYARKTVQEVKRHSRGITTLATYHTLRKHLHEYKVRTGFIRGIDFSNAFRGEQYPLLDYRECHKFIPIKVGMLSKAFSRKHEKSHPNVTLSKTKLLAFNLDEDPEEFLSHINDSRHALISFNWDKIMEINVINRLNHIAEALEWDFSDIWHSQPTLGGF